MNKMTKTAIFFSCLSKFNKYLHLCIYEIFVPPNGEGHHGVAVGHDDDREDVLGDQHEGVVHTAPPLGSAYKAKKGLAQKERRFPRCPNKLSSSEHPQN